MPRPVPRLVLSAVVVAGLALGAAACSSDEGGSSAQSSTTSTTAPAASTPSTLPKPTNPETDAGLTAAATDYLNWGNEGKAAEQYAVLSTRCLAKWPTLASWQGNVVQATKILNDLGFSPDGAVVESVTPEGVADGKGTVKAVVKTADGKTIDIFASTDWVYEDGGWRADSCESAL